MTQDRLTVPAMTAKDAQEIARRQWERDGLRVVRFVGEPVRVSERPEWRVTAEVELIRREWT